MPEYKGLISSLKKDGEVVVSLRSDDAGVVGAPEMNEIACHCVTEGSSVTFDAINSAGAEVGDLVYVNYDRGNLLQNIVLLLGLPVAGVLIGIAAGATLIGNFSTHNVVLIISSILGFLAGAAIGMMIYRKLSTDNLPVVTGIIMRRSELMSSLDSNKDTVCVDDKSCSECICLH
jgi:hypothetical protein